MTMQPVIAAFTVTVVGRKFMVSKLSNKYGATSHWFRALLPRASIWFTKREKQEVTMGILLVQIMRKLQEIAGTFPGIPKYKNMNKCPFV